MRCIYTTNHSLFLEYVISLHREGQTVWFCSGKRWATAKRYLASAGVMPILIREITREDEVKPFACTHEAELVGIKFADEFSTEGERRDWILPHLEIHRSAYAFGDPELSKCDIDERVADELEGFIDAETFYGIRSLKRIKPILLTNLVKDSDGEHVSGDYDRSYAICRYPVSIDKAQ